MSAKENMPALLATWLEDDSFHHWAKGENEADYQKWEAYFEAHPEERYLATIGRRMIEGFSFRTIPEEKERQAAVFEKIWTQIQAEEAAKVIALKRKLRRQLWTVAASFLVLVLAGIVGVQVYEQQEIIVEADFGKRKTHWLPDSSKVILNANSTITYQRRSPYLVTLDGEAFFEVTKRQDNQPAFEVNTNDLVVKVLGTAFNVHNREQQTEVFLREGKVELLPAQNKQIEDTLIQMIPGDLVTYSTQRNIWQKSSQQAEEESISWKDGTMTFKNEQLIYVLEQMQYIYGIKIYVGKENLKQRRITIALPNENLKVALTSLQELLGKPVKKVESDSYLIQ
ncbi:MAG: FecR domain-containing protein [Bacteroidota bacterium]